LWNDVAVEAYYSPARTIGGDFGVVLPHGDAVLSLLVCDVSGHGIGSALVANRIYSETLHQLENNTGPSKLLRRLHDFVHNRIAADGFYFTMAASRFVQRGRRMAFAAAGHPPAMLISSGDLRRLDSHSGILGCLAEAVPSETNQEIDLTSGDRLILYTDGLTEIFNTRDEMLGVDGLEVLVRESARKPLAEMKQSILDGVAAWRNGPLADDLSLVIVEVR
jgi:sigma-B regulation protein RsbU (phosphoserine phosphatase)